MQIESINMQKFNENKSERKISKEDKERKLSSPGKLSPYRYQNWYHKFSEEAVRSSGSAGDELGSKQLSIDANNMIVIEGRKRSATFDKTKVNIEYIGRAAGSNAVSTEDMTDREESSENTRETNESPRATSVERIGEAGNTCERYSKATLLSERDNLERCQIEHIAHIGSRDAHIGSKELTILKAINSSLENTRTCNHMTLRNVDDLQNQSDMKSELYAKEHVLETDTNATNKGNVLKHGEVIVEENKTIKQPEENIQSKGLVNDGFIENDTDMCKTSIAGLEMKPMEILQTGETQLKLTRKSYMNLETQHNAYLEPDMNLIENVDNQFTDNTNKDFVNNTTAMGTCTNEQDIANNIRTPIHSIDRNFSNNAFDINDTVQVNVNGLSPETTQKYQNEINDIHPNMTQESLIGRHASNTSISNELGYHEKEQAKKNTTVHNEINTVMPSPEGHEFKDTNQSTNQHSIVSNDTLPRHSTKMFSSFKWRRRSREKIKPEEKIDGQEMKIEFKIFDINIVRHEEAPHSVHDTRKI